MIYPDASALVCLFKPEVHSPRAAEIVDRRRNTIQLSDFVIAEVSSALAAIFRQGRFDEGEAVVRFGLIDEWLAGFGSPVAVAHGDIAAATTFVRRSDLRLRAPDALHLAVCRRIGATLLTFDADQAVAATALGIDLAA